MIIRSSLEYNAFHEGGRILAALTQRLVLAIQPGKNAADIDELARKMAFSAGVKIAFEDYMGFPAAICVSLNDEVAHGVPHRDKIFKDGDLVSLDFGIIHKGFYTDYAVSFVLGSPDLKKQALVEITKQALDAGIDATRAGVRTGDIGAAIQGFVQKKGNFGIIRKLVGHGIGTHIHEEPKIPNFGMAGTGYKLSVGEVIAIEPMITLGSGEVTLAKDNQTYQTVDGSLAAHFEKTMIVKEDGVEVVTQ